MMKAHGVLRALSLTALVAVGSEALAQAPAGRPGAAPPPAAGGADPWRMGVVDLRPRR